MFRYVGHILDFLVAVYSWNVSKRFLVFDTVQALCSSVIVSILAK